MYPFYPRPKENKGDLKDLPDTETTILGVFCLESRRSRDGVTVAKKLRKTSAVAH